MGRLLSVKVWIALFLLSTLIALAAIRGMFFLQNSPTPVEFYKVIEVPEGATFGAVADLLAKEQLITSQFYFRILGKWTQSEKKIKPGEYSLHTAMLPTEILDYLVKGKILQHQVVIPEGSTSLQIARILEEEKLVSVEVFEKVVQDPALMNQFGIEGENFEGFLFPDTYQFPKRTPAAEIIKRMVTQFQVVYGEPFRKRADELGMSQREVVTLASMIEEETSSPSERAIISAVFHNRLKKKMRLQSDPTVMFALADFHGRLTKKNLATPSPYNTYRFRGLPPGPIANPGRDAIYAALYPANVDYLFFVSKNDRTHYFSKSLVDHNAAVHKYQRKKS